jgi:hypothetical protein
MIRPRRGRMSIENIIIQRSTPSGSHPILHPFSINVQSIRDFIKHQIMHHNSIIIRTSNDQTPKGSHVYRKHHHTTFDPIGVAPYSASIFYKCAIPSGFLKHQISIMNHNSIINTTSNGQTPKGSHVYGIKRL